MKYAKVKLGIVFIILLVSFGCKSRSVLSNKTVVSDEYLMVENRLAQPVSDLLPEYPDEAFDKKIEGHVTFKFDIDPRGNAVNAVIVESSAKGVFEESAKKLLNDLLFKSYKINNTFYGQKDMEYQVTFDLKSREDEQLKSFVPYKPSAMYSTHALLKGYEGEVTLIYDIAKNGSPFNIRVEPGSSEHFVKSSMNALKLWKCKQNLVNGRLEVLRDVKYTFTFLIDDDAAKKHSKFNDQK